MHFYISFGCSNIFTDSNYLSNLENSTNLKYTSQRPPVYIYFFFIGLLLSGIDRDLTARIDEM